MHYRHKNNSKLAVASKNIEEVNTKGVDYSVTNNVKQRRLWLQLSAWLRLRRLQLFCHSYLRD